MDIANQLQEITVCIHEYRFIASLKKVAGAVSGMVDPSGVTNGEVLHDARKGNVAYLNCHVNMVVHTAEGMEPAVKAFNGLLQDQIKPRPVGIPEENRHPGVAPNHDVIDCTGEMYARFTSHILQGRSECLNVNPDPAS